MKNNIKYNSEIIEFLKTKYGCDFTIEKSGVEFNGNDGDYIHAFCKSAEYSDTFSVFCYPESKRNGEKITIDNTEYIVCDEYAEVAFRNSLNEQISQLIGDDFLVRCQVEFSDYFISKSEYEKGMLDCLSNDQILSHITVYVIAPSNIDWNSTISKVETYCENFGAYRQYLYFATTTDCDMKAIEKDYLKNADTFDSHMLESKKIERIEFSLLKRGEGVTKRSVEKE